MPFQAEVLGVEVTVRRVDVTDANEVVAVCQRGRARQAIPILSLPLPTPRLPVGSGLRPTVDGRAVGQRSPGRSDRALPVDARPRARIRRPVARTVNNQ